MTISVVLPTIPGREALLGRAWDSAMGQTIKPEVVHVITDPLPDPATYVCSRIACARNNGLRKCDTPWVAFLDDDNWWQPHHLETLLANADGVDIVFTHSVKIAMDETGSCFVQYTGPDPNAALVRTDLANSIGGFEETWEPCDADENGGAGFKAPRTGQYYEDLDFWQRCMEAGGTIRQVAIETWNYEMGQRMDPRIGERRHLDFNLERA